MSTFVSSCSGRSMRRIHHPGLSLGANVSVCLWLPSNVPMPATGASRERVRRRAPNGHARVSARRVSSISCALKRSYAAPMAAALPKTIRPILYSGSASMADIIPYPARPHQRRRTSIVCSSSQAAVAFGSVSAESSFSLKKPSYAFEPLRPLSEKATSPTPAGTRPEISSTPSR